MQRCVLFDKIIDLLRDIENNNDHRKQQDGIKIRPQKLADNVDINFF